MRLAMAIDTTKCIGCHACSVACKSNNNLPQDIWWNRVDTDGGESPDTARGTYPSDLHWRYLPINCQHCSKPLCVAVCPTGASQQDNDTGIVSIDNEACIGCGACLEACPYDVRTLVGKSPGYAVDFPLGEWDAPKHIPDTMTKCTFCKNRLDRESIPACMELCLGRARYWGDLEDPTSEINQYLEGKNYEFLHEDSGSEPNVFYIIK